MAAFSTESKFKPRSSLLPVGFHLILDIGIPAERSRVEPLEGVLPDEVVLRLVQPDLFDTGRGVDGVSLGAHPDGGCNK